MLVSAHVTYVLFSVQSNKIYPDYGFLLELHALTHVACSYALLFKHLGLLFSREYSLLTSYVPYNDTY